MNMIFYDKFDFSINFLIYLKFDISYNLNFLCFWQWQNGKSSFFFCEEKLLMHAENSLFLRGRKAALIR